MTPHPNPLSRLRRTSAFVTAVLSVVAFAGAPMVAGGQEAPPPQKAPARRHGHGPAAPRPPAGEHAAPLPDKAPAPRPTGAQAKQARERFNRGVQLYRDGSFGPALAEFQAAYDMRPHYSVLFNIAQCFMWLHRPVDAIGLLQRYVREGGPAVRGRRRGEVDRMLSDLGRQIAHVTLMANVEGAEVTVDGTPVGNTPLAEPLVVSAGPHTIAARAVGHRPVTREVAIVGGEDQRLELSLDPQPAQVTIETEGGESATLSVDDRPMGSAPWTGELGSGTHRAVLRARGTRTITREFQATAGQALRLTIGLGERIGRLTVEPDAHDAVVLVDNQPAASDGVVSAGVHALHVEARPHLVYDGSVRIDAGRRSLVHVHLGSGSRHPSGALFYPLLGLVVAGVAAGTTFGVLALGAHNQYGALVQQYQMNPDPTVRDQALALADRGDQQKLFADIGFGVAVVAAIAATLYYFLAPTERSAVTETQSDEGDLGGLGTLRVALP